MKSCVPLLLVAFAGLAAAQVSSDDILEGPGRDWLTYAGNYGGWRHSPLTQITPENAGSITAKWVYRVPNAERLQATPIAHDGVLYVTDSNTVYAIDARSGRLVWSYVDSLVEERFPNRGAAIRGDRIYFVTTDNHLTALDRRSGGVIFRKQYADVEDGVLGTAAPLVVQDKVIVGSAGGDSGVRGFVAALSAETGEEIWRRYTIPAKGEPGADTWGEAGWLEWGGGAAWLSGTYDPETETLFWPTGNPWPDFNTEVRKGDNLYTCSLLALDLATGALKWHFQFTPNDSHDWDAQSWPMLVEIEWNGAPRKVVLHANRNGFFYVLDRETGEFLQATKLVDNLTWATGIDQDGRPILVPGMDPTVEGNWVCPSVKGATNWMGQTYHPGTGLLYVLTLEQCGWFTLSEQEPVPLVNFAGGGATYEGGQVVLRAIDPESGQRVWEYPMTGIGGMWSGTVSTATGVLFSGDDSGHLIALEAKTGRHLWNFNLGEDLHASPIIYAVEGKQYIAIASATAVAAFGLFEPMQSLEPPTITVRK